MDIFYSSELLCAFFAFVGVYITIVLWNQLSSNAVNGPIYERHRTFRFHLKRMFARLQLILVKRKEIPDNIVDQLQVFSDHDEMPVDAVAFNSSSESGQVMLFATARRKHGLVNTIGLLKVPEFSDELLVLPVFPKTSLYQTEEEENCLEYYTVAGIKIKSIVPKKEYHLEYKGKMVMDSSFRKEVDVQLSAVWRSNLPTFNFSTNISKPAMSEAMALESWSRQWFDDLKSHHQTHFEQHGNLEGAVKIDGKEYSLQTSGFRDHTIGARRNWRDFRRYVLHFIRLSNGNAITVGVISVPVMFRRLVAGFVTNAKDNINIPIDSCSIDLDKFNMQNLPDSYEFDFIANNDSYRVHVNNHTQAKLYMGEQMECCLIEKWCDFSVNGIKGWGAAEWQYRNNETFDVS